MKLIEKELERSKAPSHEVKEVKLLLESNHAEDLNILRKLSKNSELSVLERNYGNKIELEKMDKEYNGNTYSLSEIRNICIRYRLRFLSSQLYKGKFDSVAVQKIKSFAKEMNLDLNDHVLKTKFFIIAPPEMFSLEEAKYVTKRQLDPVMMYKVSDDIFKKIYAWGADFTPLRRLIGWKWERARNEFIFNATIFYLLIFCFIFFLFSTAHI
jgi:hypothetical protein